MPLADLRNIGIVAHIDAGKTTVTERILNLSGVEHRVGRVDEGTATMDWMAEERERGITIASAATQVEWAPVTINLIDTPGHVDFTVEVERCMRVLDGAVLVVDAVAGVQAQTETVWRQMSAHGVPCLAFVNKCDKPGADVLAACESLSTRLGATAVAVAYPIMEGEKLVGVVDCIAGQARFMNNGEGHGSRVGDVPAALTDEVEVLRAELLDELAELNDSIMELVLEGREVGDDQLHAAVRRAVIDGSLVPVLCGAALRGVGVEALLDGVAAWLPSPLDRPAVEGLAPSGETIAYPADESGPLVALAFKVLSLAHGDLTFVRVYSGTLRMGAKVWNPRSARMERIGRMQRMHADHGEAVEDAAAGDIVAVIGLKETVTGDTLCERANPIRLESLTFPDPVIGLVVEPMAADERDKLRSALERLGREDPSLRIQEDAGAGQWTLQGMGELHLEVNMHRLRREWGLTPRVGEPRVRYREAITGPGRGQGRVEETRAGREVFAGVSVEIGGAEQGWDVEWECGLDLPTELRKALDQALQLEAMSGPRFGFNLVAGRVRVLAIERQDQRDDPWAFAQAASAAMTMALGAAAACVLEPQMAFEVQTPEAFSSGIIADLASRRAVVGEVQAEGDLRTILGTVPLAQMFGYSTVVRSLSQGRAGFTLSPAGFVSVAEDELEARGLAWL